MMHAPPFTLPSKLQLPKQPQKLDWATECQTPLNANDDKSASATDEPKDPAATSPGSEDGPDQPSTPPTTRVAPQKPAFSPSPLLLPNGAGERLAWRFSGDDGRGLADELLKMQIRDKKLNVDDVPSRDAPAHSRGSSGDTSSSDSSAPAPAAQQLQINTAVGSAVASKPYTAAPGSRPRSFQGGLDISDAERKRLQLLTPVKLQGMEPAQGPKTSPPREGPRFHPPETSGAHQPRYPSLQDQPQSQPAPTYPSIQHQQQQQQQQHQQQQHHHQQHRPPPINVGDMRAPRPDDEYMPQGMPGSAQFAPQGRMLPDAPPQFRPPRAAPQFQPMPAPILAPPAAGYAPYGSPHLPLGPPTPQMYDLTLPGSPFRAAHQHSASDPASAGLRDAQQLALMAGMHHPFGAGTLPPSAMLYQNQFFQDAYQRMPQPGPFPQTPNTASYGGGTPGSAGSQNGGGPPGGPSANNRKLGLYKTELCRSWEEKGSCRYGPKCQFAHGEDEIRKVARHPKYKTEICRTFWVSGSCPYGKRCCFIHTELPVPSVSPAAGGSPPADTPATNGPAATVAGRTRSPSTNSDPTDAPVSLLTRIAAQRSADAQASANANANAASTPTEGSATPTYQFAPQQQQQQQRPNALRVDTSALDALSMKQNKSAYPYTHTHSLPKAGEHAQLISPGPVTAGPDLGRSSARFDVVGYNERYKQQTPTTTTPGQQTPTNTQPALRHSFNGTETLNLQTQHALASGHASPAPAPTHGRSESTSSTGWGGGGGFTRGLGVPANANASSPWSGDLSVGANRLGNNNSGNNNNNWS